MEGQPKDSPGIARRLGQLAGWIVASNRRLLVTVIAVLLLVLLVMNLGSGDDNQPAAQGQASSSSDGGSSGSSSSGSSGWTDSDMEYQLAVIDAGGFVPYNDPVISQYDRALDALEPKCTEPRRTVSDQSVKAVQILAEEGVRSNALEMLRAANDAIPPELGETTCSEIFATLIVLMTG